MMHRSARILFSAMLITAAVSASAVDDEQISITEYELEDYRRHPRMEEEDRLRGHFFTFAPGLEIITDINDVEIRFFEEKIGNTPWEQDNLAAGAYRVRLERTGFEILEFWVTVRNDRRTVVLIHMGEPTGTLVLDNLPSGARVMIDRQPVEGDEVAAPAGRRSLRVSAFGWETVQATIDIPPGGRLEWRYEGKRTAFELMPPRVRPPVLPPGDRRGFRIEWSATSGGSADIRIFNPDNEQVAAIPFAVTSSEGTVNWIPTSLDGSVLPEGEYRVVTRGTGYDDSKDSAESSLYIDSRFKREARPAFAPLPGLLYAPGSAMLPRGIWQASTGAGIDIGSGIPANIGIRFSPALRWEFAGKFGITARDPFDTTSIGLSFSGSWRANPKPGPYSINLVLLFSYDGYAADFGRIPSMNPGMALPGLQFSAPMEFALGNWNIVVSPSVYLTFLGTDTGEWRFAGPARLVESIGTGVYYEDGRFLVGLSAAVRGPDYPREFLDYTVWCGLEGRFDLPGDASYLAVYTGVRTLDADPVVSMGIEFGVIR